MTLSKATAREKNDLRLTCSPSALFVLPTQASRTGQVCNLGAQYFEKSAQLASMTDHEVSLTDSMAAHSAKPIALTIIRCRSTRVQMISLQRYFEPRCRVHPVAITMTEFLIVQDDA
jgi:hypothetical protein